MLFFGFQGSAGRFLITVVLLCVIEMASFGWMSAIISARSEMEMVCCLDLLSFSSCLLRHQSCICASSIHIWRSFSCHRNCTQKFCVSPLCVRQRSSPHLFQTGTYHKWIRQPHLHNLVCCLDLLMMMMIMKVDLIKMMQMMILMTMFMMMSMMVSKLMMSLTFVFFLQPPCLWSREFPCQLLSSQGQ